LLGETQKHPEAGGGGFTIRLQLFFGAFLCCLKSVDLRVSLGMLSVVQADIQFTFVLQDIINNK